MGTFYALTEYKIMSSKSNFKFLVTKEIDHHHSGNVLKACITEGKHL